MKTNTKVQETASTTTTKKVDTIKKVETPNMITGLILKPVYTGKCEDFVYPFDSRFTVGWDNKVIAGVRKAVKIIDGKGFTELLILNRYSVHRLGILQALNQTGVNKISIENIEYETNVLERFDTKEVLGKLFSWSLMGVNKTILGKSEFTFKQQHLIRGLNAIIKSGVQW